MVDTTKIEAKSGREISYYRRRLKNRIFARLAAFFADEAKRTGVTKKEIALRLNKDPAQISRWLSGPSNLTLDTISDLLLALDAEADPPPIVRFSDRLKPNYMHPLIASITASAEAASDQPQQTPIPLSQGHVIKSNTPTSGQADKSTNDQSKSYSRTSG